MNVAAQIRFTPGTVISRRISGHPSACWAISRSTAAISVSRNSMWRIPASTDSRSSSGSSRPASHRRPLTPNRSEHGGLPCRRRCSTAWISFFARERECTSCSRRASRRRNTRQRSSGIHTDSSSPDHNSLRQRARVQPVGLRARLRDPGVIRADHDHPVDVRLEDPRDLPAAARHLQRHPIRRHQALRQHLQPLRRARHPTAGADLAVLTDRDHAEVTVNIQADRSTDPPRQRHPHLHQRG